jgi:hypothetical protein
MLGPRKTQMRRLFHPLLVLLALVFLFEAWLWERLAPMVAFVVARIPLRALKARVATQIATLSPTATLAVFIVPFILLLPLKFLEFWLLAQRNWVGAIVTLVLAKLIGLGVTAFIFDVTRPKLLQLAWFAWLYERVLSWLAWAHALVDPIKERLKTMARLFGPAHAGRTLRLLSRIRRRMRAPRPAE